MAGVAGPPPALPRRTTPPNHPHTFQNYTPKKPHQTIEILGEKTAAGNRGGFLGAGNSGGGGWAVSPRGMGPGFCSLSHPLTPPPHNPQTSPFMHPPPPPQSRRPADMARPIPPL